MKSNNKKLILLIFIMMVLNISCLDYKSKEDVKKFDLTVLRDINFERVQGEQMRNYYKIIIYIRNGGCAFCIGNLKVWDSLFKRNELYKSNLRPYYVLNLKNSDTLLTEYYLQELKLKDNIYFDRHNLIGEKINKYHLEDCLFLDSNNNLIYNFPFENSHMDMEIKKIKELAHSHHRK